MMRVVGVALVALSLAWGAVALADGGKKKGEEKVNVEALLLQADKDATRGRFKKAIPSYKKVLQNSPNAYPAVYFNLAEISRELKDYTEAALLYQRYLDLVPDAEDKVAVERRIKECERSLYKPGKLRVMLEGPETTLLIVNGIPAAEGNKIDLLLAPGKYTLVARATDHIAARSVVEVLASSDREVSMGLKKKTFYGQFAPKVEPEGAAIFIDGQQVGTVPVKEPIKLEAGKHFVEFKKDGYHRWIRNVVIERDEVFELEVNMQRQSKK